MLDKLFSVKRSMTPKDGFEKVKRYMNEDNAVCLGCRDYDSDFMFFVGPAGTDPSKMQFVGLPKVVSKKTGKVTEYDETDLQGKIWKPVSI